MLRAMQRGQRIHLAQTFFDAFQVGGRDQIGLVHQDDIGEGDLLRRLGALDAADRLLPYGRELARLPAHPRLAHLLQVAGERGVLQLGAGMTYRLFCLRYDMRLAYDPNYSLRRQLDQTISFGVQLEIMD